MIGIFALKGKQRGSPKGFSGQHVFTLLLTGFGNLLVKHCGTSQLTTGQQATSNVAPFTNKKFRAVAGRLN